MSAVVISNECNEPTPFLVQPIGMHGAQVMYFGCVYFRGELGFLNCVGSFKVFWSSKHSGVPMN